MKPLAPYHNRMLVLNGLHNKVRGDGDSHMRGMSCLLTGIELFPGNIQGGSDTPAGWAKGISIDQEIKKMQKVSSTIKDYDLELKQIDDELKIEVKSKEKTQKDLSALENASKQVSKVMQTLKKQFEDAKAELNISIDDLNKAERLLEVEKTEHEKLKEDLDFLQGTTIGSEEDTERKIKAMEVEIPKEKELADEMNAEAQTLADSNKDQEEKIKEARIDSLNKPAPTQETGNATGASIGTSLIVKNLTKETTE